MRTTLTENAIRAADPDTTLWDGSTKHFGVRVYAGGQKSFIVLLGSGRRVVIGQYPTITLAQARHKARQILAEKTLGRFQPQTVTWNAALDEFLEYVEANNRARTHKEYSRALKLYFGFGTTRLVDITHQGASAGGARAKKLSIKSAPSTTGRCTTSAGRSEPTSLAWALLPTSQSDW